jgi:hypothetical protein
LDALGSNMDSGIISISLLCLVASMSGCPQANYDNLALDPVSAGFKIEQYGLTEFGNEMLLSKTSRFNPVIKTVR